MDIGLGLCQPATAILLVAVAGSLYHIIAGQFGVVIWWIMVGLIGTPIFQLLCRGGLEPFAWILMSIPILIVCFFLSVALFAARMRIETVREVPCDHCGRPKKTCGCPKPKPKPKSPCCHPGSEGFASDKQECGCQSCNCISAPCPDCGTGDCLNCGGSGCPYCAYANSVATAPVPIL